MNLPNTQHALAELAANRNRGFGLHAGHDIRTDGSGAQVGEVMFDASAHSVEDINPFSLMEAATGIPHVLQTFPDQPLGVNVVIHHGPSEREFPWVLPKKLALAKVLGEAVSQSLPGIADRAYTYVAGEVTPAERNDRELEIIEGGDDPEAIAQSVAEVCLGGLTFVISDFEDLPLERVCPADFSTTVALKTNHAREITLLPNTGVWRKGGEREVDTGKKKSLAAHNAGLIARHENIVNRLERAGMRVAQLTFDPDFGRTGINERATDKTIADIITRMSTDNR